MWLCLCLSECVCLWLSMCVCMCGGLDKFHVKGSRSLPRVASKLYVIKDPYPSNIFRRYKRDITMLLQKFACWLPKSRIST